MAFVRIMVLIWADMLATYVTWIMQTYLTDVWNLGFTHAAGIMNVYTGLTKFVPLILFLFVDSGMDNFWILFLSSIAFSTGLGFLSMSTPPVLHKATHTCSDYQFNCIGHTQKALFYTALVLIAVGISGHIVSLITFALDQLERIPVINITTGRQQNIQFLPFQLALMRRNRANTEAFMTELQVPTSSATNNRRQQLNDSLEEDLLKLQFQPLEAMLKLVNRQKKRNGGSISDLRVLGIILVLIVAVIGLIALPYIKPWKLRFGIPAISTLVATLVFISGSCKYGESNLRELRTQREERSVLIRMVPIWITCIICGVVTSIGNTYFVEQANHMNYKVGILKFPNSILLVLYGGAKASFKRLYDRIANFLAVAGKKKYAPPIGIAIAAIFSILCCIIASIIETLRIHVIRSHGLLDKPDEKIPMTVFLLFPQFFLLAGLDSFYENSVAAFLTDQSPPSTKKYLVYLNPGLSGLGNLGSVLSVYLLGKISEKGGRRSWFQHNLNESRLDYYYWVLAGLSAANFIWFLSTAICFPFPYTEPVSSDDTQETTANEGQNNNEEFINSLVKENEDII